MNVKNTNFRSQGSVRPRKGPPKAEGNLGWKKDEAPVAAPLDPMLGKFCRFSRNGIPVCFVCGHDEDGHNARKCVVVFDNSDQSVDARIATNLASLEAQRAKLKLPAGRIRRSVEEFQAMEDETHGDSPEDRRVLPGPTHLRRVHASRQGVEYTFLDGHTVSHAWAQ